MSNKLPFRRLILTVAERCSVVALFLALVFVLATTSVRADLIGHGGMVRAVDVSPDGQHVLTGSFDFTARLWSFGTQSEVAILDEHEGPVTSVAFLPNGDQAITTSDDKTAILWDLKAVQPLARLKGHTHKVMTSAVSPDGALAATGGWDKSVRVWDLATGETLAVLDSPSPVNSVAFVMQGKWIAAGGHDGKVSLWSIADGKFQGYLEGHELGVTQLSAAPDGDYLLTASIDRTLRLWDVATRKQVQKIIHGEGRQGQVYSISVAPDGKTAISAGKDGRLVQWRLKTGKALRTIHAHDAIIWAVRFTPDGRFAVTASSDENAKVWHLDTGDRIGLTGADEEVAAAEPWLTSDHPGAKVYTKCAKCHSLTVDGPRRSGPHFAGLWGRPVGGVEDYKYSAALTGKDFVWDEKTLFDLFDLGPDVMLPGTKMPVQRVTNDEELRQLVDYLRVLTTSSN